MSLLLLPLLLLLRILHLVAERCPAAEVSETARSGSWVGFLHFLAHGSSSRPEENGGGVGGPGVVVRENGDSDGLGEEDEGEDEGWKEGDETKVQGEKPSLELALLTASLC
mmetsp:Transcript_29861/g.58517  ORF Transcript_29861/g.58517 Transcript_29861/m.58517 type:complete len:111 (+) Transcript_29861:3493-3825(+)